MSRWTIAGHAAVVMAVVPVLALAACTSTSDPSGTPPNTSATAVSLSTHCGIDDVEVAGRWYERTGGLLDDGQGNPPPGWANPTQTGAFVTAGELLVFTDDAGHRETFRLHPGATGPKRGCA